MLVTSELSFALISSSIRSKISYSSSQMSAKPSACGSYFCQALQKASKLSSPILIFCSEAEAANPSRIIAMNKLRKTRLTIRMKAMKKKYDTEEPQPWMPNSSFDSHVYFSKQVKLILSILAQSYMIPFQLSPVATLRSVNMALPKFSKLAWRVKLSCSLISENIETPNTEKRNRKRMSRAPTLIISGMARMKVLNIC